MIHLLFTRINMKKSIIIINLLFALSLLCCSQETSKKNKISSVWYGDFSLLLDEGHNVAGDYTGVGYNLSIRADSAFFSGVGYQVYFKALVLPVQKSDMLEIYFSKLLDGNITVDQADTPIIKMYKRNKQVYFISNIIGKPDVEYKVE